jgi:hypothetical protein
MVGMFICIVHCIWEGRLDALRSPLVAQRQYVVGALSRIGRRRVGGPMRVEA